MTPDDSNITQIGEPPAPSFRKNGLGWLWDIEDYTFSVDYIKRHGEDLHGVLTIESKRPGELGLVHEASQNFSGLNARRALAKHLQERIDDMPWMTLVEQFSVGLMRRANKGADPIKIGNRPEDETVTEWVVHDLIPKQAMTWWYGARASCKSQTAALMAVSLAQGEPFLDKFTTGARVGILDYEDNDRKWEHYLQIISRGLDVDTPDIFYRHCTTPIVRELNSVAKMLDSEGVDFLIVDSFGHSAGAVGERSSYEEVAINFGAAVKELDMTVLVIDHISQAARANPKMAADPLGSQYKMAVARAGYELRMEKTPGSPRAHIGIFDRKHQMLRPIGVLAHWTSDTLTFEVEDMLAAGTQMAMDSVSAGDRLMWQLRAGRRTEAELGESLGLAKASVTKLILKGVAMGKLVRLPDDTIGLAPGAIYSSGLPVRDDEAVG